MSTLNQASSSGGGAASEATLLDVLAQETITATETTSIDSKTPPLGQATMAASSPVVIASNQSAVPVSGPVTDAQLRATPVPVSGPVTDAQLRATPVPVSASALPLPTGAATEATLSAANAKIPALVAGRTPMLPYATKDGGSVEPIQATENGALNIGNAYKKFRDGFAALAQGAEPDTAIWDFGWTNQGTGTATRAGNAQGASYLKISMCPLTIDSEFTMTTVRTFKFPMRFINLLSISQRIIGQEFEVSIVGVDGSDVIETLPSIGDNNISGSVTIASNVATINFASDHGLKTSDRVILFGNTERRLNVGPVQVTVITARQITVPCTLANGTYTAGGVVRWADPLAYARNGAGLLYENATVTNATFLTRRNGFNTRLLNSTVTTTSSALTVNYADPFQATGMNQIVANQEEFTLVPRAPDSVAAPGTPLKWQQGLPDEEIEFKIRIRAKNLSNLTRPVARITAISKTGTTTATVTTDVPHGLATTDFVQIYGVRDITNFPNLVASTQVASIISATQFTIVIGSASTTSSAGGTVFLNQGSQIAPGSSAINVQSIARTNNIIALVGNTTWTGFLPGETIHLYGCDATSMGLYDGAYKVLRINTTTLELESIGGDFVAINCGGAVMRRTDFRVHSIAEIEYTRLVAELASGQGSADNSKAVPVNVPAGVTIGSGTVTTVSTVTTVTNPVTLTAPTATTVKHAAITVGTSPVRLTNDAAAPTAGRRYLGFRPDPDSTAKFFFGAATVSTSSATRGIPVFPGELIERNNDAGEYYIISDTVGQTVFITEQE